MSGRLNQHMTIIYADWFGPCVAEVISHLRLQQTTTSDPSLALKYLAIVVVEWFVHSVLTGRSLLDAHFEAAHACYPQKLYHPSLNPPFRYSQQPPPRAPVHEGLRWELCAIMIHSLVPMITAHAFSMRQRQVLS